MSQKINASEQESIVIVGAGVCGLTLAAKLLEAGVPNPVVLIEKESRVGGLARSFSYGDYIFDIGQKSSVGTTCDFQTDPLFLFCDPAEGVAAAEA